MKNPRWRAAVAAAIQLCALGLLACAGAQLGGRGPAPGNGPGGKPMRTATETAVGMPAAAAALVYPVTARVKVSDSYFGTQVEDRSEEHTSELQSQSNLVCRLLLEK